MAFSTVCWFITPTANGFLDAQSSFFVGMRIVAYFCAQWLAGCPTALTAKWLIRGTAGVWLPDPDGAVRCWLLLWVNLVRYQTLQHAHSLAALVNEFTPSSRVGSYTARLLTTYGSAPGYRSVGGRRADAHWSGDCSHMLNRYAGASDVLARAWQGHHEQLGRRYAAVNIGRCRTRSLRWFPSIRQHGVVPRFARYAGGIIYA